jgi:biotin-(acetyl-CoA carboxylase) ligase
VLGAIIRRFALRRVRIGTDFEQVLTAVRRRCVLTGRRVSLTTARGPRQGIIEGIAGGGELLLRTTSGLESLIQANEIRILHDT